VSKIKARFLGGLGPNVFLTSKDSKEQQKGFFFEFFEFFEVKTIFALLEISLGRTRMPYL